MKFEQFIKPLAGLSSSLLPNRQEQILLFEQYLNIEKIWWENFSGINRINLVIVGESPLSAEKYIYNKSYPKNSNFLYTRHIEKIASIEGKQKDLTSKADMLDALLELGVLILDLFPYPLSRESNLNYSVLFRKQKAQQGLTQDIFLQASEWHLTRKMLEISSKSRGHLTYAFRYARNFSFVNGLKQQHAFSNSRLCSIHKDRNDLDQTKLIKLFKQE